MFISSVLSYEDLLISYINLFLITFKITVKAFVSPEHSTNKQYSDRKKYATAATHKRYNNFNLNVEYLLLGP